MSDDTPTEKFDPKKDGATPPNEPPTTPDNPTAPDTPAQPEYPPTMKLPAHDAPSTSREDPAHWPPVDSTPAGQASATPPPTTPAGIPPTTPGEPTKTQEPKKKRTLMWWLIGIGAALLITLVVLLIMLFGGADEPAVAPTPTETSASPTPEPEPSEEPEPTPTETVAPPPVTGPTFATFSAPSNAECEEGDDEAPLSFSWSSSDATTAYIGVGTQNAALNPTFSDLPPTATFDELSYDCGVASQVYTVTLEDAEGRLTSNTVTITAR